MAVDTTLRSKVEDALRAACAADPHPEIKLEDVPPNRIAGYVLSESFAPLSPSERQDLIWAEL